MNPIAHVAATRLTTDLSYGEGPRWHDGKLWFSDLFRDRICTVTEREPVVTMARFPRPSGLGFLSDGSLVAVALQQRRVYRVDRAGLHLLADLADEGVSIANDMVVSAADDIYVNRYFAGVAALPLGEIVKIAPGGGCAVVASGLPTPNGMGILPDERTMLVSLTSGEAVVAFDIDESGDLSNARTWAHLPGRAPDGLAIDETGAIWIGSYATSEFLRVAAGGMITHRHETPGRWAVAPMLGGHDRRTLFMFSADTDRERRFPLGVSTGQIETARVAAAGAGRP